jgi:hypothetical protein
MQSWGKESTCPSQSQQVYAHLSGTYGSRKTGRANPHMASAVLRAIGLGSQNSQAMRSCGGTCGDGIEKRTICNASKNHCRESRLTFSEAARAGSGVPCMRVRMSPGTMLEVTLITPTCALRPGLVKHLSAL